MTDLNQAQSFLVIRLGAIGDVLRTLPAVARIKRERPDARIGWVVEDWVSSALQGNPLIDKLHVVDRKKLAAGPGKLIGEISRIAREVADSNYDVALDFHGRFKSGVISWRSGIGNRIGFTAACCGELNYLFNNIRVGLDDPLENRVLRFLHLLGPLGFDSSFDSGGTGVTTPADVSAEAEHWYSQAGSPEVLAYPGCSKKRAYSRWPEEKWVELLKRLGEGGHKSVVFWGPAERELCERIAGQAGDACSLAPQTTIAQMMAMSACFKAYVGGNTATEHMSWLQGVPCAVFTGPVLPRTDAPLDPVPHVLLRADEHYDPHRSKKSQGAVTSEVTVDTALTAVTSLLSR